MKLYSLSKAKHKTNNIIYNSPHSGEKFPPGFFSNVAVDLNTLLCSGDSFVDQLFAEASNNGSVLISNLYARSFIDTNRDAFELDPTMISGEITKEIITESPKVTMGFGSIAKYAYTRENIYKGKIPFVEILKNIETYYYPVHKKLAELLNEYHDDYGYSLLIDCHSMPSYEFLGHTQTNNRQADIILGDLHGKSCDKAITNYLTQHFQKFDLTVSHNAPFAGGYNTSHYSAPQKNQHAIQIEIKKSLYMNEKTRTPNEYMEPLKIIMSALCDHLNNDINDLLKK